MADNMPDFDKMSPEEMMRWMESLAKRQGASSDQLLTDADLEIAEVDPDTVILDEPGYVPSEGKSKGQAVLPPAKPRQAAAASPTPVEAPPPVPEPAEPPVVQQPAASVELPTLEPLGEEEAETEVSEPAGVQSAMAWLESLAADQSGGLPEIDLSALGAEIEPVAVEPVTGTDPIQWLEGLTESQGEAAPVAADTSDPFAGGVDPMNWLESLAKRQGAKNEEFMTQANLDVPEPASVMDSGPGYTDYSVDIPAESVETGMPAAQAAQPGVIDPSELESPADWLDSLASGQGFTTKAPAEDEKIPSDDEMKEALRSGKEIAPEEMEAWFNRQLDRGFERNVPDFVDEEEAEPEYDPEAPAIPAALPDWLSEMAPAPPEPPKVEAPEQQAFIDQIVEPPAVPDMPDWLREEVSAHSDLDLDNIFASTEATAEPPAPEPAVSQAPASPIELQVDHSDPWVEAFDHEQGIITLPDVPVTSAPPALQEAELEPEEELPAGQPESVPDWLSEAAPAAEAVVEEVIEPGEMPDWLSEAAPAAEPVASEDMPDWLKEVGAEVELHEIPDWLKETSDTEEQVVIPQAQPAPAATTPVILPAVAPASPAPVPAAVTQIDVAATLSSAHSLAQSDLDAGLLEYEKLVRANVELDAVVGDLTQLVSKHDKNPAVYRVLGDGLMRKGQLQAALDTYRKALNLL